LWFDDKAEEAANFYVSIFKNSKIGHITRYGEAGAKVSGRPKGTVMTVTFEIEGQEFMALNGGPHFTFSEAISFIVNCGTQEEIDEFWEKLSDGGRKRRMRLVERQVWAVLADRSLFVSRDDARQRFGKNESRNASHR
jgi:predicted 3-demethylubiquinone-9 3-methyltransferase (glyoxalase superfamily)